MRKNRRGVGRHESDDDLRNVESQSAPLIAAYRPAICRHGGRRGHGRWVGRPEAGRDARRRDLGDGLDHACRRRHCSR